MTEPDGYAHQADVLMSQGATREQAILANMAMLNRILLEVARAAGGELRLEPGFMERIGLEDQEGESIGVLTDPETEEFVVRVCQTPHAYTRAGSSGPGIVCGSKWHRELDPDKPPGPEYVVDRVTGPATEQTAVLRGPGGLEIEVACAELGNAAHGWRRIG